MPWRRSNGLVPRRRNKERWKTRRIGHHWARSKVSVTGGQWLPRGPRPGSSLNLGRATCGMDVYPIGAVASQRAAFRNAVAGQFGIDRAAKLFLFVGSAPQPHRQRHELRRVTGKISLASGVPKAHAASHFAHHDTWKLLLRRGRARTGRCATAQNVPTRHRTTCKSYAWLVVFSLQPEYEEQATQSTIGLKPSGIPREMTGKLRRF